MSGKYKCETGDKGSVLTYDDCATGMNDSIIICKKVFSLNQNIKEIS